MKDNNKTNFVGIEYLNTLIDSFLKQGKINLEKLNNYITEENKIKNLYQYFNNIFLVLEYINYNKIGDIEKIMEVMNIEILSNNLSEYNLTEFNEYTMFNNFTPNIQNYKQKISEIVNGYNFDNLKTFYIENNKITNQKLKNYINYINFIFIYYLENKHYEKYIKILKFLEEGEIFTDICKMVNKFILNEKQLNMKLLINELDIKLVNKYFMFSKAKYTSSNDPFDFIDVIYLRFVF